MSAGEVELLEVAGICGCGGCDRLCAICGAEYRDEETRAPAEGCAMQSAGRILNADCDESGADEWQDPQRPDAPDQHFLAGANTKFQRASFEHLQRKRRECRDCHADEDAVEEARAEECLCEE